MARKKSAANESSSAERGAAKAGTSGTTNPPAAGSGPSGPTTSSFQAHSNELFHQEQEANRTQNESNGSWDGATGAGGWHMSNFFLLRPPTLFGPWDGVFSSCVIHLFGVIVFLRTGWMVGNAGILLSVLIVAGSMLICSAAALAAIFISQRCAHLEGRGTIHFLMSHVLGTQLGGAVSVVYSFGQAVSCALHAMGFAESIVIQFDLLGGSNAVWVERGLAASLIIILLVINILGVKWVVRLQFILLGLLGAALADFVIGIFAKSDPDFGVLGFGVETLEANLDPKYESYKTNVFTVFGVFFPAVTGVMAGINMSGDLARPNRDIPIGTFSALGVCGLIYLTFILGLGGSCDRHYLLSNMMISERVSFFGFLLLAGLYTSSISHCLGSLYTGPRILQNMASENVIPLLGSLAKGRGPNKVPTQSLLLFSFVTLLLIGVGRLNGLAPVVTIVYLFTYAAVEYAYFSLAMTFDIQRERDVRYLAAALSTSSSADGMTTDKLKVDYGTTKPSDLDRLFPERRQGQNGVGGEATPNENSQYSEGEMSSVTSTQTGNTSPCDRSDSILPEIRDKPAVWWSRIENRWVSISAAIMKVAIMFAVEWHYALSLILFVGFVHFYIGKVNPGAFPGISEFKLLFWFKSLVFRAVGKETREYEHIVVTPARPNVEVQSALVSEEGRDYETRDKYHQSVAKESKAPQIESD